MGQSFKEKLKGAAAFYGKGKLFKIGVNAFIPNKASLKVAFNKINYSDYYYFNKHYGKKVRTIMPLENNDDYYKHGKKIWTMWLQGEENAPDIVKACWNSVRKHLPNDYELIVLNKKNLPLYINLPDEIEERYLKGKIKMAHYSDLVRLKLLIEYGGYWIDSTVFCTNSDLFNYISGEKPPLFVYKNMLRYDDACALSNWLIYSEPNNIILRNVYELLIDYWKKHVKPRNYFLFHILFKVVVERMPEEWNKVPTMENVSPHVLAIELFKKFNDSYYQLLSKTTSFHKLTYRNKPSDLEKKDTYYRYIITNGLEGR